MDWDYEYSSVTATLPYNCKEDGVGSIYFQVYIMNQHIPILIDVLNLFSNPNVYRNISFYIGSSYKVDPPKMPNI